MCLVIVGEDRILPDDFLKLLDSIDIEYNERKADNGTMVFRDQKAQILDSKLFERNSRFALLMGWSDELVPTGPFVVKGVDPNFPESGTPTLTVRFQDKSHVMNKKDKRKRWKGSASSVIKKIAKHHGLGWDIDEITGLEFSDDFPLVQANISDAALMQKIADRYGYVWGVDGHNLYFKRPEELTDSDLQSMDEVPVLNYRIKDNTLKSFKPRLRFVRKGKKKGGENQVEGVKELGNLVAGGLGDMVKLLGIDASEMSAFAPDLGKLLALDSEEERSDDEDTRKDSKTKDKDSGVGDAVSYIIDPIKNVFDFGDKKLDDEVLTTGPGTPGGAPAPANDLQAMKLAAAKALLSSEIIDGEAIPFFASMRWRPRESVIFDGIGERLSTQYRIVKVHQRWGRSEKFHTSLHVKARRLKSNPRIQARIAALQTQADMIAARAPSADVPGAPGGTEKGSPGAIVGVNIDAVRAKVTLVNSKESG